MKWEWLFLLLFYGLSMYVKRKQQKNINREIEEDPDWDSAEQETGGKPANFLETFLESQGLVKETIQENFNKINFDEQSQIEEVEDFTEYEDGAEYSGVKDLSSKKNKKDSLENVRNIKTDRRIKNRRSDDHRKKIKNTKYPHNKLNKLFHSMKPLKQSIILKEILDKPLSLRNKR